MSRVLFSVQPPTSADRDAAAIMERLFEYYEEQTNVGWPLFYEEETKGEAE